MNDISWMIEDMSLYINSASNVKLGFALDVGSEVEIGYFRFEI